MRDDQHPGDEREDAVRALLAGLGDPGPMPDDVVRRIQARLEVERAHREQESEETVVVPLRRRRPVATWLLAGAAAAVAVALGGDVLLHRINPGDQLMQAGVSKDAAGAASASLAQHDAAAPADAAASEAAADAAGSTAAAAVEGARPASVGVTILPHLGRITDDPAALASLLATTPLGSPSLTVAQADWCRDSLPEADRDRPTTWARASWADEDVVVAVSGLGTAGARAVVLPADCTTGRTVDPVVARFSLPSP